MENTQIIVNNIIKLCDILIICLKYLDNKYTIGYNKKPSVFEEIKNGKN